MFGELQKLLDVMQRYEKIYKRFSCMASILSQRDSVCRCWIYFRSSYFLKYLFKIYAAKPVYTEVIVDADTEQQAIEKVKNLKSEELEWQNHALKKERVTYEVFIKSDKDSTE